MMRADSPTGNLTVFFWFFLAQHKNIGVVVLQKQEGQNGCSCS